MFLIMCHFFLYILFYINILKLHISYLKMSNSIPNPNYDNEWRQFLYNYYTKAWQESGGQTHLEDVYPIAKKLYETRNKVCDIELNLMASKRKHKK